MSDGSNNIMDLHASLQTHFREMENLLKQSFTAYSQQSRAALRDEVEAMGTALKLAESNEPAQERVDSCRLAAVHPATLAALQNVIRSPEAKFTSPEQAELINSVASTQHVIAVLETGGGKSASFFCAPKLYPGSLFIVVSPLNALTYDLHQRMQAAGLKGGIWSQGFEGNVHEAEIVIVPAHKVGIATFRQWLNNPHIKNRIKRIFIDECHKILTDKSYRECFSHFFELTAAGVPMTFLSGSLMPSSIPEMLKMMKIQDRSLVDEIRRYTGRPNLKYISRHLDQIREDVLCTASNLVSDLSSRFSTTADRGIIFTRTIEQAEELEKQLKCCRYVANMDPDYELNLELKGKSHGQWRNGSCPEHRWMVATQAFGQGVDYPYRPDGQDVTVKRQNVTAFGHSFPPHYPTTHLII
ncbi:hypothetical protein VKT23_008692 [Stygiomarasmius scandens]|uniref:Helicase ATP-binding domain-containing protein n=1 Tax=Marasmiellus scandens TaxID=2682957 RepID=A0ABR1JLF5_9AGAR